MTMDIPTKLKTCTYIVTDRASLTVKARWLEKYKNACEVMGVKVETVDTNTFQVRGNVYPPNIRPIFDEQPNPTLEDFTGPPPKIPIPKAMATTEVNSAPESLLELTDFVTVYSRPSPVCHRMKPPPPAPSLAERALSWLSGRVW